MFSIHNDRGSGTTSIYNERDIAMSPLLECCPSVMTGAQQCSIRTTVTRDMFSIHNDRWLSNVLSIRMTVTQTCALFITENVTQQCSIY